MATEKIKTTAWHERIAAFAKEAELTAEETAQVFTWLDANGWPRTPSLYFTTQRSVTEEQRERALVAIQRHLTFSRLDCLRLEAYHRRN